MQNIRSMTGTDPRLSTTTDQTPIGNVYPRRGIGLGVYASAGAKVGTAPQGMSAGTGEAAAMSDDVQRAVMIGNQGSALSAFVVIVALLFILMFAAKRIGSEGEFSNIKMSFYNVLVISFAAIIGIPIFKFVFTKIPIPGLSTYALAV